MSKTVTVGISDLNMVRQPDALITYALGSCVGICLFDPVVRVIGMSHILLPNSTMAAGGASTPMKFADTAIPLLVTKMQAMGAKPMLLKAKIAGGAQMFAASGNASIANIGARNVEAVRAALAKLRIPVVVEDVGSNYGRTVLFKSEDFSMTIRSPKRAEWVG